MTQQQALAELRRIESAILAEVDWRTPLDSVPDRIAMPVLNRLEADCLMLEESLGALRNLVRKYLEDDPNAYRVRELEAWKQGAEDYRLGKTLDKNPYHDGKLRDAWQAGWAAQRFGDD